MLSWFWNIDCRKRRIVYWLCSTFINRGKVRCIFLVKNTLKVTKKRIFHVDWRVRYFPPGVESLLNSLIYFDDKCTGEQGCGWVWSIFAQERMKPVSSIWKESVKLVYVHICTINCKTGSCPYLYNKLCQTKEEKCCQDSCMKRSTKF